MALSVDEKNTALSRLSEAVGNSCFLTVWNEITTKARIMGDDRFAEELHEAFNMLLSEAELT